MNLTIDVFGDTQFSRELLRIGDRAEDMTPVFRELADDFLQMEREQFDSEGRHSGGWTPLKPSTIESKQRRGLDPRILHATLALRKSLTVLGAAGQIRKISADELVLGTDVRSEEGFPYPAAHQRPLRGQTRRRIIEFTPFKRVEWTKAIQRHILGTRSVA